MRYGIGDIRRENVLAVMDALVGERTLTRGEIARRCGLSLTTVGKDIDELMDYGVLSQQHSRSGECGRTPTLLTFSDAAPLLLFHITARERVMMVINFRMQILASIRREVSVDCDPNEEMRIFLLDCRRVLSEITGKILICGLCTEEDPAAAERLIEEILGCEVEVTEQSTSVLARGARYEGIATENNCVVIMTDGASHGTVLCRGEARMSDFSYLGRMSAHGEMFSQAMLMLCFLLSPDVLLLCVSKPSEELRRQLKGAVHKQRPAIVEIRDAEEFFALGMGLALREAWLEHITAEDKRLRGAMKKLPVIQ